MKKLALILCLNSLFVLNGQTVKTYSGQYEGGTATYQYYENENYDRILHGSFQYKIGQSSVVVNGQFNNNLRNGLWKITRNNKDLYSDYKTIETVTANYIDGNLNGVCSYTKTNAITKQIIAKSTANFINNKLVGNYSFLSEDKKENKLFSINLQLNQDGFADGTSSIQYTYESVPYEDIRKYKNGILYWQLQRNLSDGRKLHMYDVSNQIDSISNDFADFKSVDYDGNYETFDSNWDLYIALYFWQNGDCGYCGSFNNEENPLYILSNGVNIVSFYPVKKKKKNTIR